MGRLHTRGSSTRFVALALVLGIGVGLAGCKGCGWQPTAADPGTLNIALRDAYETFDPCQMSGVAEALPGHALFEGLLLLDPAGEILPGVAETWDVSDDGCTYTFHLRDNAMWVGPLPDGGPIRAVTAPDFVYSWDRVLDPANGSPYGEVFFPIVNGEAIHFLQGVITWLQAEREAGAEADITVDAADVVAAYRMRLPHTNARLAHERETVDAMDVFPDDSLHVALSAMKRNGVCADTDIVRENGVPMRVHLRGIPEPNGLEALLVPGYRAIDERTLEVELIAGTPYFLELIAFHSYLPVYPELVEANMEEIDDEYSEEPIRRVRREIWMDPSQLVTNGPFRLKEASSQEVYIFEKNPHYWDATGVALDKVQVKISTEQKLLMLFDAGELDYADYFDDAQADQLKQRDEYHINPYYGTYYYRINVERPPFDDPEIGPVLRRAIAMVIDKESICRSLQSIQPTPATGFVPPGADYPMGTALPFDPERARALLETVVDDPADLPALEILFNSREDHEFIATKIMEDLQEHLGLDAEPKQMDWSSYLSKVREEDYMMARAGWIGDYVAPETFLTMWVTGGGNNNTNWGNARYDRIIYDYTRNINGALESETSRQAMLADMRAYTERVQDEDWMTDAEKEYVTGIMRDLEEQVAACVEGGGSDMNTLTAVRYTLFQFAEHILLFDGGAVVPIYFYNNRVLASDAVGGIDHANPRQNWWWRFLSIDRPNTDTAAE